MRMIRPKLDAPQITIAENQVDEFKPVTAAVVKHDAYPIRHVQIGGEITEANSIVVAFRPSDEERARIAAGEDIYIAMLTFLEPMQGLIVTAGATEMAQIHNVREER